MDLTFLSPSAQDPALRREGEKEMRSSLASGLPKGYEVGYGVFTINGRMLGHGDPIRVRRGERVLFHILNGSATEVRSLALPGHTFGVVALDGNPVPRPRNVPVLWIGTAERIDAIVEMNEPGVWILGDTDDDDRRHGMGIVVEYAGSREKAQWKTPPASSWDYRWFGAGSGAAPHPDETFAFHVTKRNAAAGGFNVWTLNGKPYGNGSSGQPRHVERHGSVSALTRRPALPSGDRERHRRHSSDSLTSPYFRNYEDCGKADARRDERRCDARGAIKRWRSISSQTTPA